MRVFGGSKPLSCETQLSNWNLGDKIAQLKIMDRPKVQLRSSPDSLSPLGENCWLLGPGAGGSSNIVRFDVRRNQQIQIAVKITRFVCFVCCELVIVIGFIGRWREPPQPPTQKGTLGQYLRDSMPLLQPFPQNSPFTRFIYDCYTHSLTNASFSLLLFLMYLYW